MSITATDSTRLTAYVLPVTLDRIPSPTDRKLRLRLEDRSTIALSGLDPEFYDCLMRDIQIGAIRPDQPMLALVQHAFSEHDGFVDDSCIAIRPA